MTCVLIYMHSYIKCGSYGTHYYIQSLQQAIAHSHRIWEIIVFKITPCFALYDFPNWTRMCVIAYTNMDSKYKTHTLINTTGY